MTSSIDQGTGLGSVSAQGRRDAIKIEASGNELLLALAYEHCCPKMIELFLQDESVTVRIDDVVILTYFPCILNKTSQDFNHYQCEPKRLIHCLNKLAENQ